MELTVDTEIMDAVSSFCLVFAVLLVDVDVASVLDAVDERVMREISVLEVFAEYSVPQPLLVEIWSARRASYELALVLSLSLLSAEVPWMPY